MLRKITCIMCPSGCDLEVDVVTKHEVQTILDIRGSQCARGKDYARQEILNPMRNIASSIPVRGGAQPLASVRLNQAVPKDKIFDIMAEIRRVSVIAPVMIGDTVIRRVAGTSSDVIITKNVEKQEEV